MKTLDASGNPWIIASGAGSARPKFRLTSVGRFYLEIMKADRTKQHAGLAKGRATQQYARGTMTSGKKAATDAEANRQIGHTFHSLKGKK